MGNGDTRFFQADAAGMARLMERLDHVDQAELDLKEAEIDALALEGPRENGDPDLVEETDLENDLDKQEQENENKDATHTRPVILLIVKVFSSFSWLKLHKFFLMPTNVLNVQPNSASSTPKTKLSSKSKSGLTRNLTASNFASPQPTPKSE